MEYWQNRSVQQIYEAMKDAEEIADQISKVYMKASLWLDEQGRDIFERFRKKWDLSEEDARKLIEAAGNGATAQQLVQTYLASGGKDKDLIREMESYAFRTRLERIADIGLQLDHIMRDVYRQEVKKTTQFYKSLANDQYYKTIFHLQKRCGYGFSFAHVSEKQVDRMLQMKWYGQNYSQRIWKNTKELTDDLKTEMLVSLITGRTDRETAEIFNQKYGAGAIKSRRLIRTEAAWVSSRMVLAGYKDAKIKEYRYLATLDLRTSEMCRKMDGKIFPLNEYVIGKTAPPLHPWCRSTTAAVINREWLKEMKRSARNAQGKVIMIPANMNYQEWYDTYIKGDPAGEASQQRTEDQDMGAFFGKPSDVTLEWKTSSQKSGSVEELFEYSVNDETYKVDGKRVLLDYSAHEKKVAELIARETGKHIKMVPRVTFPQGIQTPDYLIDGECYDLKTPLGSGKNTLYGMVKSKKKQANNFVIDADKTELGLEELKRQTEDIFHSKHTAFVDTIILIKDNKITKVYKRNK